MSDLEINDLDIILVPQGAEYQAICRGLRQFKHKKISVFSIPLGMPALSLYLQKWQQSQLFLKSSPTRILVMGLCGSLSPHYQVGDIVIYQTCCLESQGFFERKCDSDLTNLLWKRLQGKACLVRGLTCDRVIWSTQEKLHLRQMYQADVVDMEGYTAIEMLDRAGIAITMLRVVSDDSEHNIPNLTPAINSEGSLQPFLFAAKMAQNPLAATRLIYGSLKGLKVLQQVTQKVFV